MLDYTLVDQQIRPVACKYSTGLSLEDFVPEIRIDSTGIDSVDVLSILEQVELALGMKLGLGESDFDQVVTYGDFVNLVLERGNQALAAA